MYIDSRFRNLLWNHRGYILAHPPKSAGTSLRRSLVPNSGFFTLNEVLVPNLEGNAQAKAEFEAILDRLQSHVAMDRPWIDAGLKYATITEQDLPCLLVQRTARLRGGKNLDTK